MTKCCPQCRTEKDASEFNKANRRDGLRSWCRSCESVACIEKSQLLRAKCLALLGNECQHCGFKDPRALQIDHVNGGGNREHKEIKNTRKFYDKVLADTSGTYQLLCANCNWIKRHERKENLTTYVLTTEGRATLKAARAPISDQTRALMREVHLGQKPSLESRLKRGESLRESWKDPEVRAKREAGRIAYQDRLKAEKVQFTA